MGNIILDILFPKFCVVCKREQGYLCQDCISLIDILEKQYCPYCFKTKCHHEKSLNGLYCACSYENHVVKKAISQFKYSGLKELAKPLALLILYHFINLKKDGSYFKDYIMIPVPLYNKKMRKRGFNQSEEIAKNLLANIPLINNVLLKKCPTLSQASLEGKDRESNVAGTFECINKEKIKDKHILLIDDVYTTGSTLEECAKTLKESGAKQVWGVVIARQTLTD